MRHVDYGTPSSPLSPGARDAPEVPGYLKKRLLGLHSFISRCLTVGIKGFDKPEEEMDYAYGEDGARNNATLKIYSRYEFCQCETDPDTK